MAVMLTREQFLEYLRDGLGRLHDPDSLCRSPLATLFGVARRSDTYSALQRILTEAIASLEPGPDVPSGSRAWRIYDLLTCRYMQELSAPVVADQLGMSVRHLRREQRAALEALAYRLWEQFDMEETSQKGADTETMAQAGQPDTSVTEELAWLREAPLERPTDLEEVLSTALDLVRPLATQYRVRLELHPAGPLPGLAVHPVALNQVLLNLVSAAIHRASGGRVRISTRPLRWTVEVQVQCMRLFSAPQPVSDEDAASLDMAHSLVDMCGGRLTLLADGDALGATLTFPAFEQLPVLVIEDNADALQLLTHYTSGTRYRLVGTRDPEQALTLAEKLSPQIVVLDVMMPQVDGWWVLGRLRQHPLTSHIPIVVCTILTQEELALSLGASAFLHKPVTRRAFLDALDAQVARMEPKFG